MSTKLKVALVVFISLISVAAWSFAEEAQIQTVQASNSTVKQKTSIKKTKAAKVTKEKAHKKAKKTKKEIKAGKQI